MSRNPLVGVQVPRDGNRLGPVFEE